MRTVPLTELTGAAWRQMATLLFKPFRWRLWLKLLLIAWLSGYLQGGCNINIQYPTTPSEREREHFSRQLEKERQKERRKNKGKSAREAKPYRYADLKKDLDEFKQEAVKFVPWVAAGALMMVAFIVLMCWLFARFSFVFVDVLKTGKVAVIEPFKRFRDQARTLFYWQTVLSFLSLAGLVAVCWFMMVSLLDLYAQTPELTFEVFVQKHIWDLIEVGVQWMLLLMSGALLIWIVMIATTDFIVPIMYCRSCHVLSAWKRLFSLMAASPWEPLKYFFWRLLLMILAGIAVFIAMLLIVLLIGLLVLVGVLIGMAVVSVISALKVPLIVAGFALGFVIVLVWVALMGLIQVPVGVWLRIFSLRYLQALNAGYDIFPASVPPRPVDPPGAH